MLKNKLRRRGREGLPLHGLPGPRCRVPLVEELEDEELTLLNKMLEWNAYVLDSRGRRFGNRAWAGKRDEAQAVPDPRIVRLHELLDLSNKHVLEIGCFEGIHTAGLMGIARSVTALDSRIDNVVKTIVRLAMFGYTCPVLKVDVEELPQDREPLRCDVIHHVGVLYHLADPVAHLHEIAAFARVGIMLDTHFALDEEATENYDTSLGSYRYKTHDEGEILGVFSGMRRYSKWLRLDDLKAVLDAVGFSDIVVEEVRTERNGPRVCLIAKR